MADQLLHAAPGFTTSPLYRHFCTVAAADHEVLDLLAARRSGQHPAYLLFGAVHYLLLAGAEHPLRDFYASMAGERAADPLDAGPAFLDFCRAFRSDLHALVSTRLVQTNVVNRVIALRYAMSEIGRRHTAPLHLIDVGASAGTHLQVDRYRYRLGDHVFGQPTSPITLAAHWPGERPPPDLDAVPAIASRVGVDLDPPDVADADQRRWLRALVWPEDDAKAETLTRALELAAADPPRIIAGDIVDTAAQIAGELPDGEPRLVFHAAVRMHVAPARIAAFDEAIDSFGAAGPLFHVWAEPPYAQHHGAAPGPPDALQMHGPDGSAPVVIARADGHLAWIAPPL